MIAWFLGTKVGRILAAISSAVLAILFFYWKGRLEGASATKVDMMQKDMTHAEHLQKAADAARISTATDHRPVDKRLRDLGALRD